MLQKLENGLFKCPYCEYVGTKMQVMGHLTSCKNHPRKENHDLTHKQIGIKIYVANGITYSDINQFKSNKAKEIASQLIQLEDQRSQLITSLRKNRLEYGRGNTSVQTEILKQEKSLEQLDVAIQTLENNIRKEEQTQLKIN